MKRAIEKHTEKITVPVMIHFHCLSSFAFSSSVFSGFGCPSSPFSSSSTAWSADHIRELTPTTSESMKDTTPRRSGIFQIVFPGMMLL